MAMDAGYFAFSREKDQGRSPNPVAFQGAERLFHVLGERTSGCRFLVQDLDRKSGTSDLETFDAELFFEFFAIQLCGEYGDSWSVRLRLPGEEIGEKQIHFDAALVKFVKDYPVERFAFAKQDLEKIAVGGEENFRAVGNGAFEANPVADGRAEPCAGKP